MSAYYLKSLDLLNIGPFEKHHLEFGPGVNIITGDNHTGKTTCLHAAMNFFEGGSCADLVPAEKMHAEMKITFSDGSSAKKTFRRATGPDEKDDYKVEVRGPANEVKKQEAAWLNERVPKGTFDVESFLKLDPKDRSDFITKRIAVNFTAEEINAILMAPVGAIPSTEQILPPLKEPAGLLKFNEIYATIEDLRRQANVAMRDKEAVLESLRSSALLGASDKDWSKEVQAKQAELVVVERSIASKEAEIKLEAEQARTNYRQAAGVNIGVIEKQIAQLQQQIAQRRETLSEDLREVDEAEKESIIEHSQALIADRARLTQELGEAQAHANHQQQSEGVRTQIKIHETESKGLVLKHLRRDNILKALDKAKHEKLKNVQIEGFDLKYNARKQPVITIHGTPLEQLSGQEALYLAFECVTLSVGSLPILFLDDIERITETYRQPLIEQCKRAGYQLIAAQPVPGAALSVEIL